MKSCAFTGHRPQNLPFGFREDDERCIALKETLKKQIISLITDENVTHFISGMALGVDMYAAEIVLELKKTYPGITLESAIPCETQAAKWNDAAALHIKSCCIRPFRNAVNNSAKRSALWISASKLSSIVEILFRSFSGGIGNLHSLSVPFVI